MKVVDCECGESFWLNERGWPATCDLCGGELKHKSLITQTEPVAEVPCSDGLSCEHLKADGSCDEPEYAACVKWVDWHANIQTTEPDDYFCKLAKGIRDRFGE